MNEKRKQLYRNYLRAAAKNTYRKFKRTKDSLAADEKYRENYDKIDWGKKDEKETTRNENDE